MTWGIKPCRDGGKENRQREQQVRSPVGVMGLASWGEQRGRHSVIRQSAGACSWSHSRGPDCTGLCGLGHSFWIFSLTRGGSIGKV